MCILDRLKAGGAQARPRGAGSERHTQQRGKEEFTCTLSHWNTQQLRTFWKSRPAEHALEHNKYQATVKHITGTTHCLTVSIKEILNT